MDYQTREVAFADRRTRVLDAGRGRPLLLLHAFPMNADMWQPQLESPPAGWRVIAPDLRNGASMDDYAEDVEHVARVLDLGPVVVGGVSMGGYVIFALLRRARLPVDGLILADTRAEPDTAEGRAGREKLLALAEAEGALGIAREMLPKLLGKTTQRNRPEVVEKARGIALANSAEALMRAIAALRDRPDSTPLLPTIAVPTLVLVGDEDVVTPLANAETLHRGIAGSALSVLTRAGHLSSLEQPEAFSARVARFLDTV
jgi:3-oxoadipate enol-lactonase